MMTALRSLPNRIKLAIVDDQPIVRLGIVKILSEESDIEIISEVSGYEDLLAYLRVSELKDSQPNIVLLDLAKAGTNGFEILNDLKNFYPTIRVLMLSTNPEDIFALRALRAGAAGYLTRESATEELITAIREVFNRGRYITPILAKRLIDSMDAEGGKPDHERLSNRELQVLSLIATGKKIKEIAELLSLSPATIATYRSRILEKMKLKSNVELASYAVRHNLVD